MKTNKAERIANFYAQADRLGITRGEATALRRVEMALHRWAERECNGEITRDEATGKVFAQYGSGRGPFLTVKTRDLKAGALRRLASIMKAHPTLVAYHQTDPRGCALYVVRVADLAGSDVHQCYSRGLAVCY